MSSRGEILDRIRSAVGGVATDKMRKANVERRLKRHPVGILPWTYKNNDQVITQFTVKAKKADSTVERCKSADVSKAIVRFLKKHNLPAACRIGADRKLKNLLKGQEAVLEITHGPNDGSQLTGVSCALGAAAETGTLFLVSGKDNPTTLNFLSENHIVVIHKKDILKHQEDLWVRLRRKYGAGKLPRTVNLITGPSRSADIEQTLILGAHGPQRLHIIVVMN